MDVQRTLRPGDPGTHRYQRRFGDRLIAVRYRKHPETGRRITTVEVIVDERTARYSMVEPQPAVVAVRVAWPEKDIQRDIRHAGGIWDTANKVWRLPREQAKRLGLEDRIVGKD